MIPADLQLGLPSPRELTGFRIWDSYFTPSHAHPLLPTLAHILSHT